MIIGVNIKTKKEICKVVGKLIQELISKQQRKCLK
jgi:hypothetical protein